MLLILKDISFQKVEYIYFPHNANIYFNEYIQWIYIYFGKRVVLCIVLCIVSGICLWKRTLFPKTYSTFRKDISHILQSHTPLFTKIYIIFWKDVFHFFKDMFNFLQKYIPLFCKDIFNFCKNIFPFLQRFIPFFASIYFVFIG